MSFEIGDMVLPENPQRIRKIYQNRTDLYPQHKIDLALSWADGAPLMVIGSKASALILNRDLNASKGVDDALYLNSSYISLCDQPSEEGLLQLL